MKKRKFTQNEDVLILATGRGELRALANRLNRSYGTITDHKARLLRLREEMKFESASIDSEMQTSDRCEPLTQTNFRPLPFARPAWFDEDVLTLATGRK